MTDEINKEEIKETIVTPETDILEEARKLKEDLIKENQELKKNLEQVKKVNAEMELRGRSYAGQATREKTEAEKSQDAANIIAKSMGRDPLYD